MKNRLSIFLCALCAFAVLFFFAFSPFAVFPLRTLSAWAAAYDFFVTTDVSAGDVVVWDSTTAYGVKTTNVEGANTVAGVAAETVSAGNDCTIRQDGGRVTVNVTGAVTKGQWLVTSTALGKAKGVDTLQAGIFARAITDAGTPVAGQVYASVDMGYLGYVTGAVGEANTASNQGAGGVGPFDTKSGVDLQFRNLNAGSSKVSLTLDAGNKEIDVDVNEGNITHDNLSGAGANTHAQIDTHIADADKHREINDSGTAATDLWSADKINTELAGKTDTDHSHTESDISDLDHDAQNVLGKAFDDTGLADTKIWKYDSASQTWKLSDDAGAAGGEANTASNLGAGVGVYEGKSGADLQFNSLVAGSTKLSISEDDPNDEIDIDVNEENIIHQNLSGVGTNSHAQIDTHIADAGKHREINDSGAGATELWSADKINTELDAKCDWNISERFFYFYEFLSNSLTSPWNTDTAGGGSLAAQDQIGGVVRLNTGTAQYDYVTLALGTDSISFLNVTQNIIYEARVKANITDDIAVNAGIAALTGLGGADHRIYFKAQYSDNSGLYVCVMDDISTEHTYNTSVDPSSWHVLRIEASSSAVSFYIDGNLQQTFNSDIPTGNLMPAFKAIQAKASGGVSGYLDVDAVYVEQDR